MKNPKASYMKNVVDAINKNDEKLTCIAVSKGVGHYVDLIISCLSNTPVCDMPLILTALKHIIKIISNKDPKSTDIGLTIEKMAVYPDVQITQWKKSEGGKQNGSNAK